MRQPTTDKESLSARKALPKFAQGLVPALSLLILSLLLVRRQDYLALTREDATIEWLTFASLLFGGLLSMTVAIRRKRDQARYYGFSFLLSLALIVGALEEISWGQRLFGFQSPEFFLTHSDQKEMNAHNVLQKWAQGLSIFGYRYDLKTKDLVGLVLVLYGGVLPVLARSRKVRRFSERLPIVIPPPALAISFWIGGLFMIDEPTGKEEEVGEFLLSLCLLLFVWSEYRSTRRPSPRANPAPTADPNLQNAPFDSQLDTGPAVLLVLSLVLLLSTVATEFILYSRNTLAQNQRWKLSTMEFPTPPTGALHTTTTRNILHRNRLNLGVWHGYQEIFYYEPLRLASLSCDVSLEPSGVLEVMYAIEVDKVRSLRLSRHPDKPTAHLTRSLGGKFLSYEPVPGIEISNGWYHLEFRFLETEVLALLDGLEVASLPELPPRPYLVGFSGEAKNVMVDNVKIVSKDNGLETKDDFRNRGFWFLWVHITVCWVLLCLLFGLVARRKCAGVRKAVLPLCLFNLYSLAFLSLVFGFDYFLWSKLYAFDVGGVQPSSAADDADLSKAEQARTQLFQFFENWNERPTTSHSLRNFLQLPGPRKVRDGVKVISEETFPHVSYSDSATRRLSRKEGNTLRILLVGTSQTYGEGAFHLEKTLGTFLFNKLSAASERPIEIYNCSRRGSNSASLFQRYREFGPNIQPDYVVINLSHNDLGAGEEFYWTLQSFVALTKALGAELILVQEANNPEFESKIHKNHEKMADIAKEHSLTLVPLHHRLLELESTGRLWYDVVHLTSYGQKLAADLIAEAIINQTGSARTW